MNKKNFTISIMVNQTPQEVFNAVNNIRGWWSENIQDYAGKLNTEFHHQYKDIHYCKMKITELVPNKKIVWHVLENDFNFTKDKHEWEGNDIVFEITEKDGQTQLKFTQQGLTPAYECYTVCSDAWSGYVGNSLYNLVTKGKGQPTSKEEARRFANVN